MASLSICDVRIVANRRHHSNGLAFLNPIEHVWDDLAYQIPPQTLQELKSALLEEWHAIPQDLINTLIKSIKSRCEKLIELSRMA
ncbi:hypothetical protein X975_05957, partial [Stegodyphus mimosarum]